MSQEPSDSSEGTPRPTLRTAPTAISSSGYQSYVMACRNSGRASGSSDITITNPASLTTPPSSLPNPPGNSSPPKAGPSVDATQREPPPPMNANGAPGPSLRMLCVNGQTYTLTPQVEEIFKCVTRVGTLLTRYKRIVESRSNRDSETGQGSNWNVFSMFDSDDEAGPASSIDKYKGKLRARAERASLGEQSSRILSEAFEEAKKLLLTLETMLQPIKASSVKLNTAMQNLPLLTDFNFWGGEYDSRISNVVEWDDAARLTILDQMIPQHVVVYHAIRPLLLKELPATSSIATLIQNPVIRADWIDMLGKIHDVSLEIRVVSNDALSATKSLTGGLQNCLMSLQYNVRKDFVPAADAELLDDTPSQAYLIVDSLTRLLGALRKLRMPDSMHVDAMPTSYLDIDPDSGTCLVSKLLHDIATETHFLQRYRPLHNHFAAKYLLPYFIEIANYTRGNSFTQIDRLLAGYVLQHEMILAAKWEMIGMGSVESEIGRVANSGNQSQGPSTVAEESPEGDYRALQDHKFSFKLVPLPKVSPELRNSPKKSATPLSMSPTRTRQGRNPDMSNPLISPSGGLQLQNGSPPQKIWPVSSFAVTSRGVLNRRPSGELYYSVGGTLTDAQEKAATEPKSFLDENFSLDEVLKFYAVTLGSDGLQMGVIGSQVANRVLQVEIDAGQEAVLQNPVAANKADVHCTPVKERRRKQLSEMLKRLRRFDFDSHKSTKPEPHPAIELETLPEPVDPAAGLDPEVAKALKACYAARAEYRTLLRILAEMKTEVRCAFEGANARKTYSEAEERRETFIPITFRDRECNWRKVSRVNVDQLHGH